MKTVSFAFTSLLFVVALVSCRKTPTQMVTEPKGTQDIEITLRHNWADENSPLVLGQDYLHPETNETLSFQTCNYYLSNFQFRKLDGSWWSHPFSYNLVRVTENNDYTFVLPNLPFGTYDAVRFLIGVDSARNVSGAQSGDLAPSNAMFWSWSTGYIMIKLEGNSPQANWEYFSFHIGGFRDSDNSNTTRWKEISLVDTPIMVTSQGNPKLSMHVDLSKVWTSNNPLTTYSSLHAPNSVAQMMADQFATAFSLDGVE